MYRRLPFVVVLATLLGACASTPPEAANDPTATASSSDTGKPAKPASDSPADKAPTPEPPDFKDLPVDALKAVAADIERQVAEANREPVLTAPDGLIVDTPRIRQGVRTRAARTELVNAMLDTGHAWERRNGRLWILRSAEYKKSTTSRKRDIDAIMVNGENSDRWAIYEGLIEANRLGRGALNDIEGIFFEARTTHMKPGQKYENSNGEQAIIAAQ